MVHSLLSPLPYSGGVPEIRYWDDLEASLLRIPEEQWQQIKSIPGMTGDEDFDAAMREFRAKYHRDDDEDTDAGDDGFVSESGRLPVFDDD